MANHTMRRVGGFVPPLGRLTLAASLALSLAACDTKKILAVTDPEIPTDETLQKPEALPLLVRGAMGEFWSAYGGNGQSLGYVAAVGLFTDEFWTADVGVASNAMDLRVLQPPQAGNASDNAFNQLQRARRSTGSAAAAVAAVRGANDKDRATLLALEAYSYVALAEGFCSAVPVSRVDGGNLVDGAPLTTAQLLDSAVVRFQESLSALPSDVARVGLGRALLDQGKFAAAATAVHAVPNSYRFLMEYSDNSYQNPIWTLVNGSGRFTVADREGSTGLNFRAAADPRVVSARTGTRVGIDNQTALFEQKKYADRAADIPLADGTEARLIEAEAALQAGDNAAFLQLLNAPRAGVTGLAPLADPGTAAGRRDLLFRERAFWLYATGHRLGDYRRLVKQYSLPATSVYPVGAHPVLGSQYGDKVVFPVPFNEERNPLFLREQCVTNQVG
jgi:hypothetical protein